MQFHVLELRFDPARFRVPLKFGAAVVTDLVIAVVKVRLSEGGREAVGIGAMPLGNAWSFPSAPHDQSLPAMRSLAERLANAANEIGPAHSILELSHALEEATLRLANQISAESTNLPCPIPKLCALVVFSAFDIACFDAWGALHGRNTFALLRETPEAQDLSPWLDSRFRSYGLAAVLPDSPAESLPLFHLVGGLDPLTPGEVTKPVGDGFPEHLEEWIDRDQLTHLKIKLRGDDAGWDLARILAVNRVADAAIARRGRGEPVYSLDFNEKCPSGAALVELLQQVKARSLQTFHRISYVEQPTPRDLRDRPEDDMHEAAKLKPVVIDEALTDYGSFQRARELGYSGVALKACKGIGPSLLMAAACRKDNLFLCVQDLTCPGLSLLASTSLAAWLRVEAIEANARQFCPRANVEWAQRRPEVFAIKSGRVDTRRFGGVGLGFHG